MGVWVILASLIFFLRLYLLGQLCVQRPIQTGGMTSQIGALPTNLSPLSRCLLCHIFT